MEIRADVGEHGLDTVILIAELDAHEARFRGASAAARSGADSRDAYSAAELQCGGKERVPTSASWVLGEKADQGIRQSLPLHG
eukprot:2989135-Pleurochrysis_carterae.AAC.1